MPQPAAYLRVSSADQRERESILSQELALRQYFEQRGLNPDEDVLWYRDDGISGKAQLAGREEGQLLLEDVRVGLISEVIVFSISRLSRDAFDYHAFARTLEEAEIPLRAIGQGVDTTAEGGDFMAGVLALVAAKNHRDLLMASKIGHERAARSGRWQGEPPYGHAMGPDSRLCPHPEQAPVVQEMYRLLLEEGLGGWAIGKRLRSRGVPSPRGGSWHQITVLRVLRNPAHVGRATYNLTKTVRRNGKFVGYKPRPEEEHIIVACTPIVDEAVWVEAQRLLDRRSERYGHTGETVASFILPRVTCSLCQRPIWPNISKPVRGKTHHYYYRHEYRQDAKRCPHYGQVRARPLEERVWADIERAVANPDDWRAELEATRTQDRNQGRLARELAEVEGTITATKAGLERLEDAYIIRGTLTVDRYEALARELNATLALALRRHQQLTSELSDDLQRQTRAANLADMMRQIQHLVATADLQEKRALTDALVERVLLTIHPGTGTGRGYKWGPDPDIEIEWKV